MDYSLGERRRSKPAVDIADCPAYADAEASVIAFKSVQVQQVKAVGTRNFLFSRSYHIFGGSDGYPYCAFLFGGAVEILSYLRTEVKAVPADAVDLPCLSLYGLAGVGPQGWPSSGKTTSYGHIGTSEPARNLS
ncbi:hypothetical protein Tco_1132264 [Tanacetum coccineum]|uniref:Uncharacterized protein n=1 Tax=Tanacetum coccineum TaxID=301880 RepID=A0ABQ5JEC9_9ASTR